MGNGASEHREGEEVLELDDDLLLESGQNETGMNLWCGEARLVPEHGGKSGGISRENSLNGTGDNSSVTTQTVSGANSGRGRYCLYTFFCGYRGFSWMVKVRFSDVRALYSQIEKETRVLGVSGPTTSYTLVPQRHETRPEFLRQRHREVITFLREVAGRRELWQLARVRAFFEVGARSFDRDLGKKGKEGHVLISSGGVFGDGRGLLTRSKHQPGSLLAPVASAPIFMGFRSRWLMLRDSCIAWFEDERHCEPRGVLLVDATLRVGPSPRGNPAEFIIQCIAPSDDDSGGGGASHSSGNDGGNDGMGSHNGSSVHVKEHKQQSANSSHSAPAAEQRANSANSSGGYKAKKKEVVVARTVYVQLPGRDPARRVREWLEAIRDMLESRPRALLHPSNLLSGLTASHHHRHHHQGTSNKDVGYEELHRVQKREERQAKERHRKELSMNSTLAARRQHRFGSFAPPRLAQSCSWYVCGREYFGAVAKAVGSARRQVFLADWRMNPDLLLTRFPDEPMTLKDLLRARAIAGVEIYVLLYREASEALQKKHRTAKVAADLTSLHPNIRVLRHGSGMEHVYWSHHDKLVVVDQVMAFVGGMDLTEGRFDDFLHPISDPTQGRESGIFASKSSKGSVMFPGVEYYQPNNPKSDLAKGNTAARAGCSSVDSSVNVSKPFKHFPSTGVSTFARQTTASDLVAIGDFGDSNGPSGREYAPAAHSAAQAIEQSLPLPPPPPPSSMRQQFTRIFDPRESLGLRIGFACAVEIVYSGGQADRLGIVASSPSLLMTSSDRNTADLSLVSSSTSREETPPVLVKICAVAGSPVTVLKDITELIEDFKAARLPSVEFTFSVEPQAPEFPQMMGNIGHSSEDKNKLASSSSSSSSSSFVSSVSSVSSTAATVTTMASIDRTRVPRMPWQDVAMGVGGLAARDVALHFIARWNHHRSSTTTGAEAREHSGKDKDGEGHSIPFLLPFSDNLDASNFVPVEAPLSPKSPEGAAVAGDSAREPSRAWESQDMHEQAAEAAAALASAARAELTESLGALPMPVPGAAVSNGCAVQVLRSAGSWSVGVSTERSIEHAWATAIAEAEHLIYIEQQYFITNFDFDERDGKGLLDEDDEDDDDDAINIHEGLQNDHALYEVTVPLNSTPGTMFRCRFPGIATDESDTTVMAVRVPPEAKPGQLIQVRVPKKPKALGPKAGRPGVTLPSNTGCDLSSSPPSSSSASRMGLIEGVGHIVGSAATAVSSAVTSAAIGVQEMLHERLEGKPRNRIGRALLTRLRKAIEKRETFRVMVVLPLHPNGRYLDSVECQAVMKQQFECISRGEKSLLRILGKEFPTVKLDDYIVFMSLRAHGELPVEVVENVRAQRTVGRSQSVTTPSTPVSRAPKDVQRSLSTGPISAVPHDGHANALDFPPGGPVSEQVYVHSKLLIVDDRVVVMGSANLNDRSMMGNRDSEIACRVEESPSVPGADLLVDGARMNGAPFAKGRFAHGLRVRLWREHLGMEPLGTERRKYAQRFAPAHQGFDRRVLPHPVPLQDLGVDEYQVKPFPGGSAGDDFQIDTPTQEIGSYWDDDVSDPTCAEVWHGVVLATARNNSSVLERAFDGMPMGRCGTLNEAKRQVGITKRVIVPSCSTSESTTQTAYANFSSPSEDTHAYRQRVRDILSEGRVRGRLIFFPISFLYEERLEPDTAVKLLLGKRLFQ